MFTLIYQLSNLLKSSVFTPYKDVGSAVHRQERFRLKNTKQ